MSHSRSILGLYRDTGKENGNGDYILAGYIWGAIII